MATRAAIAARDRASREKIAKEDREAREVIEKRKDKTARGKVFFEQVPKYLGLFKDAGIAAATAANHPEWYKKFGDASKFAKLPSYSRTGLPLAGNAAWLSNCTESAPVLGTQVSPGVMVFEYDSTLPWNDLTLLNYKLSPINVGLSRFMSQLRKYNSRIGDYDPSDFGLYWYAALDVMTHLIKVKCAIQAYNTYHVNNAYLADALILAHGFDPADFRAHIAEYKALYNMYANQFNTGVLIPKTLTFALRRYWLANATICDSQTLKGQFYVFRPMFYGIINVDETAVEFANTSTGHNLAYATVANRIPTMMRQLVDSVGFQTMMADLRAGIPDSEWLQLPLDIADSFLEITNDEHDKEQIHNLTCMPSLVGTTYDTDSASIVAARSIRATAEGYLFQGTLNSSDMPNVRGPIVDVGTNFGANFLWNIKNYMDLIQSNDGDYLNFYKDEVNEDDVLEATRLKCIYSNDSSGNLLSRINGTEVIRHISIITFSAGILASIVMSNIAVFPDTITGHYNSGYIQTIWSRFDWAPRLIINHADTTSSSSYGVYKTHDELCNYFPISKANLTNLHEFATISTFYMEDKDFKSQIR